MNFSSFAKGEKELEEGKKEKYEMRVEKSEGFQRPPREVEVISLLLGKWDFKKNWEWKTLGDSSL